MTATRRPRNCPIADHRYHFLSNAELYFIQKDASEAAKAMRGISETAECKYLDQLNDASTVLFYRSNNGGKQFVKQVEA